MLPTPIAVAGYSFHRCLSMCLFIRTISQNPMQLGSPNLTHKWSSTMRPGNRLILGQEVTGESHDSQKQCRRGSLHSCECWLLLVRHELTAFSSQKVSVSRA